MCISISGYRVHARGPLIIGPDAQPRVEPAIDPSRLPFISYRTTVRPRSRSRVRTDGRTVRYERQSRRVVGRELASRFFEDQTRPRMTVRPSVRIPDLDRAFTNVLRHVVRMRTRQVPHRQASTPRPPYVMFLTRPSPRLRVTLRVQGKAWERG